MKNEKFRLLIVDDEPVNISILTNLLEDDHDIMVATSGKNCLDMVAENRPDLILLDIMMPEMDGLEVCKHLQADSQTRDIPVIFISALATAKDESQGLALGAVDYITKPFVNTIVKARVGTHLKLKKQREQLLQQQHELQIKDKFRAFEVLSGGLAHDFNNLLTSIIGNLDLALMDVSEGEDLYNLLNSASHSSLLARNLAAKFLTISQGYLVKEEELHLSRTITQVVESMSLKPDIKFRLNISDPLWPLHASFMHIVQLLTNILFNSQESMPDGGTITISANNCPDGAKEHSHLTSGPYLKISVVDQGEGISDENLPKIFDPYFSTKEMGVQKGMGLGLTMCHSIIKRHQGYLEINSVHGQGTVVDVFLPVKLDSVHETVVEDHNLEQASVKSGRKTDSLSGLRPGLDLDRGLKNLEDNHQLYQKLLRSFLVDYEGATLQIKSFLAEGKGQEARLLTHSIKGIAGNLGAFELQEKAALLEEILSSDDEFSLDEPCAERLNQFSEKLQQVMQSIKKL